MYISLSSQTQTTIDVLISDFTVSDQVFNNNTYNLSLEYSPNSDFSSSSSTAFSPKEDIISPNTRTLSIQSLTQNTLYYIRGVIQNTNQGVTSTTSTLQVTTDSIPAYSASFDVALSSKTHNDIIVLMSNFTVSDSSYLTDTFQLFLEHSTDSAFSTTSTAQFSPVSAITSPSSMTFSVQGNTLNLNLTPSTLYYIRGKIINVTQSITSFTSSIQVTTDTDSPTPLITWPLSSDLLPIVDTTQVDFTTSTLAADSITATNIAARYDLDTKAGTVTYGNGGLLFGPTYRGAVGANPNTPQIVPELFDRDAAENIWTGDTDLNRTAHSFSCWVYPTSYDTNGKDWNVNGQGNTLVGLYVSHVMEYLQIDKNGRPGLWYLATNYTPGLPHYRIYTMDHQLALNTWTNIVWTFTPSSSTPSTHWRVRGYINGTGPIASFLTVGTAYGEHYKAIGPDADAQNILRDTHSITANSYLVFGGTYADYPNDQFPHTLYMKDVAFYSGALI